MYICNQLNKIKNNLRDPVWIKINFGFFKKTVFSWIIIGIHLQFK